MDSLFVFSRIPNEDQLRLLNHQASAKVLLLGPAIYTASTVFKNRTVLLIAEEVEELGVAPELPQGFTAQPSSEVMETLLSHKLFNF